MKIKTISILEAFDIQPSAQRLAVARYILNTDEHPSADRVWAKVRRIMPVISRATVYNTLNLFVRNGLLRQFSLNDGKVVFDANTERHHHFVDDRSGRIYDIPWGALAVSRIGSLRDFDVREYQVVMRGQRKRAAKGSPG